MLDYTHIIVEATGNEERERERGRYFLRKKIEYSVYYECKA